MNYLFQTLLKITSSFPGFGNSSDRSQVSVHLNYYPLDEENN